MDQPAPKYKDSDISRIIARDFPIELKSEVMEVLQNYTEDRDEPLRVQMACLKLANGDIPQLRKYIQTACNDFRDVLAWAEYRRYMDIRPNDKALEPRQKAIAEDWNELQEWLQRI